MTTTEVTTQLGQPAIEGAEPAEEDLRLWSVTTITGALDKPALQYWAGEMTALATIHSEELWRAHLSQCDPDCKHDSADNCEAVKWLRDARNRRPKGVRSATQLGTDVHAACEQYALTGTKPTVDDEVQPFLDRFDEWLHQFQPEYHATEVAVYNPELGYAGTLDALMSIDGVRFIVDYKSSRKSVDGKGKPRKPFPEQVAPQLAAYRHAQYAAVWRPRRNKQFSRRYYLLSQAERDMAQPVPEVDTGLVLHITPQACEAYPMVCDEEVLESFLAIRDSAKWLHQDSRNVMSNPLAPVRSH